MLRQAFTDRLKQALKARDARTVSTTRLILAGLKDRDIAVRGQGRTEGLSEAEIQRMLQAMIKQRRESIALYEQGNRPDLAQQEREEIMVIQSFLPHQFEEGEIEAVVKALIAEIGGTGIKDVGRGGASRAPQRGHRFQPGGRDREAAPELSLPMAPAFVMPEKAGSQAAEESAGAGVTMRDEP